MTGWARPVSATTTDRSDERPAEAAGSVESHIESPTPSLAVLHPGAPQRHSQIRSPGHSARDLHSLLVPALRSFSNPTILASVKIGQGVASDRSDDD